MAKTKANSVDVGSIVFYKTEEGEILPAIVTKINKDKVNIRVFTNDPGKPGILFSNIEQGNKAGQWDLVYRDGD